MNADILHYDNLLFSSVMGVLFFFMKENLQNELIDHSDGFLIKLLGGAVLFSASMCRYLFFVLFFINGVWQIVSFIGGSVMEPVFRAFGSIFFLLAVGLTFVCIALLFLHGKLKERMPQTN